MGKRFDERLKDLTSAVDRLNEAIQQSKEYQLSTMIDGVIQRFEFTLELSWKAIKHYLNSEGLNEALAPRSTIRIAFKIGLIENGDIWMQMIDDRNLTSHTYSEVTAKEIYTRIADIYANEIKDVLNNLKEITS
jgi:nucleotidyltransferase substrate binding protein (TIGR01987 family)